MPHSPELIAKILPLLEADYPPSAYAYSIEKMLVGTRMFPDIAVIDPTTKQACCVVEIGYTRPEKLWAYRHQLQIQDVRWYDKAGNLHTKVLDERAVKSTVRLVPTQAFSVYIVHDLVECCSDECSEEAACIGELSASEDDESACRYRLCDVVTAVITDWHHVWLPSYCDKCGEYFLANKRDGSADLILCDLGSSSPREFGLMHGKRLMYGGWDEAVALAREHVFAGGVAQIEYMNGIGISDAPDLPNASLIMERR